MCNIILYWMVKYTLHLPPPSSPPSASWNLSFKVLGEDKYFLSIHSPAVLVMVDTHKYENISVAQVCEEYQRHHQTESHCDSHSQIIRQPEQKSLSFISIVWQQSYGYQQSLGDLLFICLVNTKHHTTQHHRDLPLIKPSEDPEVTLQRNNSYLFEQNFDPKL